MIGAIVLGAGSSRRFGDDKRKARLPNGRLVIEQTTENAMAAFDEVLLVLRADDHAFKAQLAVSLASEHLRIFLAPDSALGMGHSLANAVVEISHWEGAFICLGDMPFISMKSLVMLREKFAQSGTNRIIVPQFEGTDGHPVGFGSDYFADIGKLSGDRGARSLLTKHDTSVTRVPMADPGLLRDIDTPADL